MISARSRKKSWKMSVFKNIQRLNSADRYECSSESSQNWMALGKWQVCISNCTRRLCDFCVYNTLNKMFSTTFCHAQFLTQLWKSSNRVCKIMFVWVFICCVLFQIFHIVLLKMAKQQSAIFVLMFLLLVVHHCHRNLIGNSSGRINNINVLLVIT